MFEYKGFLGFIILVLDLWAIISIITSEKSIGKKVLWTLLVIILPILGFIVWLVAGPRANRR